MRPGALEIRLTLGLPGMRRLSRKRKKRVVSAFRALLARVAEHTHGASRQQARSLGRRVRFEIEDTGSDS